MKKILSLILALSFCISLPFSAFAIEEQNEYTSEHYLTTDEGNHNYDDYLDARLRSTSVPSSYWNLSNSSYNANLVQVGAGWLYTNYYFKSNSSGKIHIEGMVYSNTGRPTQVKVGLYNLDKGKVVQSYIVTSSLNGQYFSHTFSGLSTSAKYAIAFICIYDGFTRDTVHGSANIY